MNYRKIYCDSEHCPVSGNCARHQSNLDIDWDDEVWKKIILEDFDRDDECTKYDPILEDVQ